MATFAPSRSSAWAVARPIPRAPPVMATTLPAATRGHGTRWSPDLVARCNETAPVCRRILSHEDTWESGGPALPLDRLPGVPPRRPARPRPAGVRHAAGGGLRAGQAPRHGLRDDHRPRHDRRRARARRPARRVRVGGADRVVQGRAASRCTCSATGSRPHDHEWLQRNAGDVEACAEYLRTTRHRLRAGASLLRGRGAAQPRATAAGSPSCSRSGRRATARAHASSTCPPRSTSRPTAGPASAAPTTTPESTSGGPSPRRRPRRLRKSFSPTSARGDAPRRGDQGSAAKWAHAAMGLAIRALGRGDGRARRPIRARCCR